MTTTTTPMSTAPQPSSADLAFEPFTIERHDLVRNLKITGRRYALRTQKKPEGTVGARPELVLFLAHGVGLRAYKIVISPR